ncbi:MAG: hypothetical protein KF780_00515 [Sphingomonas sp.]|nr:hypothetical protein [Sphingomonas sp.]
MRRSKLVDAAAILSTAATFPVSSVSSQQPGNTDSVLREIGAESVREISADIALPATAEEYEALGRHAIMMVRSSSAISTELPLRSVYVMHRNVRIPLHRILLLDKQVDAPNSRAVQVSFYLIPIQLMKVDSQILADFSGDRRGFSFLRFTEVEGLGPGAPAFARLDAYDTPTDPDPSAIAEVLAREFPGQFR